MSIFIGNTAAETRSSVKRVGKGQRFKSRVGKRTRSSVYLNVGGTLNHTLAGLFFFILIYLKLLEPATR